MLGVWVGRAGKLWTIFPRGCSGVPDENGTRRPVVVDCEIVSCACACCGMVDGVRCASPAASMKRNSRHGRLLVSGQCCAAFACSLGEGFQSRQRMRSNATCWRDCITVVTGQAQVCMYSARYRAVLG